MCVCVCVCFRLAFGSPVKFRTVAADLSTPYRATLGMNTAPVHRDWTWPNNAVGQVCVVFFLRAVSRYMGADVVCLARMSLLVLY